MQTFASPREFFKQKISAAEMASGGRPSSGYERGLGMSSPPIQKPSLRDETVFVKVLAGSGVSLDKDT